MTSGLIYTPGAGLQVLRLADEDDEQPDRRQWFALEQAAKRRDLIEALGPTYAFTTFLPRPGAPPLGPARDRQGQEIRWTLWAPLKRVLVDIFRRVRPTREDLEDRQAFAVAHQLRYGVVLPGERWSVEALKEWLDQ